MILFPVISSWTGMEGRRRLVQVFPDPIREWWDKWEIRGLVLISIVLQIILTLLGNRRKYGTNKVIDSILWVSYLLADTLPSIALGVISSKLGDYYDKNGEQTGDPQLMAFWAPFFLMHVGGPDTITAYSLEDNELWLRHLVGFVFQTLLAIYIILLSWESSSWLSYLSIPMLIIGCVKYGERTWSLYSASSNYSEYCWLDSYISKSEELNNETIHDYAWHKSAKATVVSVLSDMVLRSEYLRAWKDQIISRSLVSAFTLIDNSRGETYDFFYTKSSVVASIWGGISWLVTLLALVLVFTLHSTFSTKSSEYSKEDRIITLILLLGAIILHIVSAMLLIVSSNWVLNFLADIMPNSITSSRILNWINRQISKKTKRWNLIAQCDFLTFLCSGKDKFYISGDSLPIRNVRKIHIISHCPVSSNLKKMLFDNIKRKVESTSTHDQGSPKYKELVKAQRLRRRRLIIENLEFHQSILLWHIVTNVCYYCNDTDSSHENEVHSRESKKVSDYMFYLLVKQRHMLPIGAGLPSLRDTFVEAILFCEKLKRLTLPSNVNEACNTILQHIREDTEYVANHPRGRAVFRYAFILADDLLTHGDKKQTWEFLTELWIEILNYSAFQCRGDRHSKQLAKGGEFITHVWVLQFYAGLLEQFQVTEANFEDDNVV